MDLNVLLQVMSLVERGLTSVQTIKQMSADGVTDDEIFALLADLHQKHERHQDLDLRKPAV